jgi:trk system potassium uptake protein TrkH
MAFDGQRSLESLRFAVRPAVLLGRLGQLFVPLAALTVVPLAVSLVYGQTSVALRYLAVIVLLSTVAAVASRLPHPDELQTNEAMVITALVFSITGVVMSYPLMGYGLSFEDAVFEAVSGVTTTGLSTLAEIEDKPVPFLFARAWLQWVGGLGVVVLGLALLIQPGVAASRLGFDKREKDELVGGTRAHARIVLIVYVALTAAGIAALLLFGAAPFDAIVHALAAVSTGGFATSNESLGPLGPALQAVVIAISVAGAISFSWYYAGLYREIPALLRDPQIRAFVIVGVGVAVLLFLCSRADDTPLSFVDAALMAGSAQTTAGFSSTPVPEMGSSSKLILALSMLVGGELGSTAGGIKIFRFLLLVRLLSLPLVRASAQRGAEVPIRIGRDRIGTSELESTVGVVLSYAFVLAAAWLLFLVFGHVPLDAFFDVSSALATAGLSAGTVGPGLEPALKGTLIVVMLMGRVETFAFILLLYPRTWIGKKRLAR